MGFTQGSRSGSLSILSLLAFLLSLVPPVFAQQITITDFRRSKDPAGTKQAVVVPEGKDYFKDVLGNAFDGNHLSDSGWQENFVSSSVQASGGVWKGTNNMPGGYLFPLFGGFGGAVESRGLPGDKTIPGSGFYNPIDANKFKHLSYKLNHTARSTSAIYWKSHPGSSDAQRWPDGTESCARFDGFYHFGLGTVNSGHNVYSFDLGNLPGECEVAHGAWSGQVVALRLDPSVGGGVGAETQIDWLRLSDPNSAPKVKISWRSEGLSSYNLITIWLDQDDSGYNGVPIKRFVAGSNPGSFTFPSSMLPAGTYYYYITSQYMASSDFEAVSSYSPMLLVNGTPAVTITRPSPASGTDYFTANGNPADMSDASDVPNLNTTIWPDQWRQFRNAQFVGGKFQCDADSPWYHIGNSESDVQIHLNVNANAPIRPSLHRWLVFRLKVDRTPFSSPNDMIARAGVARPVFWNDNILEGTTFEALPILPGWNTYVVDLHDSEAFQNGSQYLANPSFSQMRIDPNENTLATPLRTWLDHVKLYTEPTPVNNRFLIKWKIKDKDSATFRASLSYSTSKTGANARSITSLSNLSAGEQSYDWNTSNLAPGRYYVRIAISDGLGASSSISMAPMYKP